MLALATGTLRVGMYSIQGTHSSVECSRSTKYDFRLSMSSESVSAFCTGHWTGVVVTSLHAAAIRPNRPYTEAKHV